MLEKIDYIEFYVANLPQALHFYESIYQFVAVAKQCTAHTTSILLEQGSIRIVLTSSADPQSEIAKHVYLRGDGVKNIALTTNDIETCFASAVTNGAIPITEPVLHKDNDKVLYKAEVKTFGDTIHTFIQRQREDSFFLPNFQPLLSNKYFENNSLMAIDHLAICVEENTLSTWTEYYQRIYGFKQSYEEYVTTTNSGMNSRVVESSNGNIKFVFVEPIQGKLTSQVAEYIKFYGTCGVQHVAYQTDDIKTTVNRLKKNGAQFMAIPKTYYEMQNHKLHLSKKELNILENLSILVDKNDEGYLYQIFTKPISTRPTIFFEIIQRMGCSGFGSDNIKALFKAIEKEQFEREIVKI